MTAEHQRLIEIRHGAAWRKWGPYVSERQWGTVREDYSPDGSAWTYLPHDHARSRAYRWGEDGIAGICDELQRICFAVAMWNGKDPILKERLFGLSGPEGNHGEDVKEQYWYLDATPTHSYLKMLYRYPQAEFPYARLVTENARRGRSEPEFELADTGVLDGRRYFDVLIEYAKAAPEDILIQITARNCGPEAALLHLLPQIWFRNTWSWDNSARPRLDATAEGQIALQHRDMPAYYLSLSDGPELLFCDNDTNTRRLSGAANASQHPRDAFHDYVVNGQRSAVNPKGTGTKAAAYHQATIAPGKTWQLRLRLARDQAGMNPGLSDFESVFTQRRREADEFHASLNRQSLSPSASAIQRQALGGMIWSQQFYYYDIPQWLNGDPAQPPPPAQRKTGRNADWTHLNNADILSMPDKWEYPWYAAWDLAFHCIPLAHIDPDFAKAQLVLLTREWYMHPNGQLPAYEWSLGDANPPLHAWAAWKVYQIDRQRSGRPDTAFLERIFHKLLLNFTWWVNRKDTEGRNIFQGGFLGLDNIGVFDRSETLPTGGHIDQADGTSWMAMYCLNLMRIALELSRTNPVYQDTATKFFEHFLYIAAAMNNIGGSGIALWCDQDEFFYDVLCMPGRAPISLRVRSMVGLIPLFAVEVLEAEHLAMVPEFTQRLEWFLDYRPDLASLVSRWYEPGRGETRLLSLLRGHRMKRLLKRMLDETEFLSPFGVRSLSKYHQAHPYRLPENGVTYAVSYQPAESHTDLFGGNSNWRGPVWMPLNYLAIESLRRFHAYYGDDFKVECPTNSGQLLTLRQIADELARRLVTLFVPDDQGRVLFHEYFDGDTGQGLGASHQTGWTGLIADLLMSRPIT